MLNFARSELDKVEICEHGGKRPGSDLLDFSSSTRDSYPDSKSLQFRSVIAKKYSLNINNIIAGNGSSELIRLIALAFLEKGDKVLVLNPTFGEYGVAAKIMGAQVLKPRLNFKTKVDAFCKLIKKTRPKMVFLCNPNNPTGEYLDKKSVVKIINTRKKCLFVLDEAYIDFVKNPWSSLGLIKKGNVIIVRSLTKAHGLASLRIGYAVSSPSIISTLQKVRPPWNVNSYAQKAAVSALKNDNDVFKFVSGVIRGKEYLQREFKKFGFCVIPSQTSFFLVEVGNAKSFKEKLLQYKILVRDCGSFGLPNFVRINAQGFKECKRLVRILCKNLF